MDVIKFTLAVECQLLSDLHYPISAALSVSGDDNIVLDGNIVMERIFLSQLLLLACAYVTERLLARPNFSRICTRGAPTPCIQTPISSAPGAATAAA